MVEKAKCKPKKYEFGDVLVYACSKSEARRRLRKIVKEMGGR